MSEDGRTLRPDAWGGRHSERFPADAAESPRRLRRFRASSSLPWTNSLIIMNIVLGKGRGYDKAEVTEAVDRLKSKYESLIFDHALNPALIESFEDRLRHARTMGRDPMRFLEEEIAEFKALEKKAEMKAYTESVRDEARRRRLAGETFADKVLDEYRQKIEHYPEVRIHPDADPEVAKLYGALDLLDKNHWSSLLDYFRKAYPRAGQIDRMSIEQRFWRFVSTRNDRLPEELEPYRRALAAPSATKKERIREAQEAVKAAAFFLHELLDLCEDARKQAEQGDDVERAIGFIGDVIADFRIRDLKRR